MDVRIEIANYIDSTGRKLTWLADETGIPYNTLYAILKLKTTQLSKDRLVLINQSLQTKFKL
jgi:predicted transcriptional regulator